MDGTLVNTGSAIAKTINYVRKNMGLDEIEKNELLENVNSIKINPSKYFYGTEHFSAKQTKLFEDYYNKNCTIDTELYDGVKELLKELSVKYNLAIATNAFDSFAIKILKHLKVDDYFKMVVGANNVKNPKPHPDMINKIIDKLSPTKELKDFIFIGDSNKDKLSAKKANIEYIMVNWGFSDYDEAICDISSLKDRLKRF